MPASKNRAVVFDFDGVVADSWKLHETSWRAVLTNHGAKTDDEAIAKALGWTSLETARELKKAITVGASAETLAAEKSELMLERAESMMPMMPGIPEALERLSGDFRLALMSGRRRELVDPALARYGLKTRFDVVGTIEDIEAGQELDDLLALILQGLDTKPERAVMVDDSRNGLLAAKRAGMRAIAFDSNPKHEVDDAMADSVIRSLDELVPELVNAVSAA